MKNMTKWEIAAISVIVASFVIGLASYQMMPEMMASHWGLEGNVNGYMPRFWGVFLVPAISAGLLGIFLAVPRIDPLKENVSKFIGYFEKFVVLILLFLFYVQALTLIWNLGYAFDIGQALAPAFAVLFYFIGVLTENSKRNWFVGIRTPWTLSSDIVWEKTNRMGGKLFKAMGDASLIGIAFPGLWISLLIALIVAVVAFSYVYSYFEFKKVSRSRPRNSRRNLKD
jgi:uncharacterized membrane protein